MFINIVPFSQPSETDTAVSHASAATASTWHRRVHLPPLLQRLLDRIWSVLPARGNARRFATAYAIVSLLAVHQLITSLLPGSRSRHSAVPGVSFTIAVLLLLLLLAVALDSGGLLVKPCRKAELSVQHMLQLGEDAATADASDLQFSSQGLASQDEGLDEEHIALMRSDLGRQSSSSHRRSESQNTATAGNGGTNRHHMSQHEVTDASSWATQQDPLALNPAQPGFKGSGSKEGSGNGSAHSALLDAVKRVEFWLLFGVFAIGIGSGLAFGNNLPELVSALSYTHADDLDDSSGVRTVADIFNISTHASRQLLLWQQSPGALWSSSLHMFSGLYKGMSTVFVNRDNDNGSATAAGGGGAVVLVSLFSVGSCFGR